MTRGATITETRTVEFIIDDCLRCGVEFGLLKTFEQQRRTDGREFWCPNGHSLVYKNSAMDKLKDDLKRTQDDIAFWRQRAAAETTAREAAERQRAAAKGQLTKAMNRIQNGVCPHCNRHFVNVERHMANKHSEVEA